PPRRSGRPSARSRARASAPRRGRAAPPAPPAVRSRRSWVWSRREARELQPLGLAPPSHEHSDAARFPQKFLFICVRACNILRFRLTAADTRVGPLRTTVYRPRERGGVRHLSGVLLYKGSTMPDFSQLTPRQREIYDFIKSKIDSRGY